MTGESVGLVAAEGVGRRRSDGDGWLLRDLTLTLQGGERLALVGPSGAGKSLLLRSLALLDPVDRGQVLWHGREIPDAEVPAFRSHILYLHQRTPLFPGTVLDNLQRAMALRVHRRRSFDRDRVVARLARLGRDESFLEQRTGRLSGGEAQITALLRALQLEPEVLLLDEPTAAVDPEAARTIEELVDGWFRAGDGGRALIWVSHDRDQAIRMSDRVLTMREGSMVEESAG